MGYSGWASVLHIVVPRPRLLDWIAYDLRPRQAEGHGMLGRAPEQQGLAGVLQLATKMAPGKPLMLAEFGIDIEESPDPVAFLTTALRSWRPVPHSESVRVLEPARPTRCTEST